MQVLYFFIDGLGSGVSDPQINPVARFGGPLLRQTIPELRNGKGPLQVKNLDAHMGIQGAPQSATGQTALWTGFEGPKIAGRHVTGIPTAALIQTIKEFSILKVFAEQNKKADLINAFSDRYLERVRVRPRHLSVSTRLQLASGRPFRTMKDLMDSRAISMDIDRMVVKDLFSEDLSHIPLADPFEEGHTFSRIGETLDLSIFEFFLTDLIGHEYDEQEAKRILEVLEKFIEGILHQMDPEKQTLVISSDHGNFEDKTIHAHTENQVPLMVAGSGASLFLENCHSLRDIPLVIYKILGVVPPEPLAEPFNKIRSYD